MFADLIFIMFATLLLLGGVGVITSRNPMHSVLFMIFTFFNSAGLFILLGAEFIGLLMVMVYVGAIAVMFLFVLMTINIDYAAVREGFAPYLPVSLLLGGLLLVEFLAAILSGSFAHASPHLSFGMEENIVELGQVLFTNFAYPFLMVSMILLVAMVGAIVLAFNKRDDVKRQNITEQIARKREDAMEVVHVPSGKGLNEF